MDGGILGEENAPKQLHVFSASQHILGLGVEFLLSPTNRASSVWENSHFYIVTKTYTMSPIETQHLLVVLSLSEVTTERATYITFDPVAVFSRVLSSLPRPREAGLCEEASQEHLRPALCQLPAQAGHDRATADGAPETDDVR